MSWTFGIYEDPLVDGKTILHNAPETPNLPPSEIPTAER